MLPYTPTWKRATYTQGRIDTASEKHARRNSTRDGDVTGRYTVLREREHEKSLMGGLP